MVLTITSLKAGHESGTQIRTRGVVRDTIFCPDCGKEFYTIDFEKNEKDEKNKRRKTKKKHIKDCFEHLGMVAYGE